SPRPSVKRSQAPRAYPELQRVRVVSSSGTIGSAPARHSPSHGSTSGTRGGTAQRPSVRGRVGQNHGHAISGYGSTENMASNRVEVLRAMLAQDPKNSFARYGLAMEQVKAGQLEEAIAEFRALIATDPGYAAAYFHSGQTLEKLGRLDEARAAYQ